MLQRLCVHHQEQVKEVDSSKPERMSLILSQREHACYEKAAKAKKKAPVKKKPTKKSSLKRKVKKKAVKKKVTKKKKR